MRIGGASVSTMCLHVDSCIGYASGIIGLTISRWCARADYQAVFDWFSLISALSISQDTFQVFSLRLRQLVQVTSGITTIRDKTIGCTKSVSTFVSTRLLREIFLSKTTSKIGGHFEMV